MRDTPALHIDWLTVSQMHEGAPDYGADLVVWYDPTTHEVKREQIYGAQIAGSWESSCRVRCVGGRVEFSGNPSKWGRLEAVGDGCGTLAEALAVASEIVQGEGLPAFEERPVLEHQGERLHRGPRVSRVDVAGCYLLGGPEETRAYSLWVETQSVFKKKMERKGPESCSGGTVRRQLLLLYTKWLELQEALLHWKRKRVGDVEKAREYLTILSDVARVEGWVRREVRLGSDYLRETGLCWVEHWGEDTMMKEFQRVALGGEVSEFGAVTDWRSDVRERLLKLGLSERAANSRMGLLASWMAGFEVGPGVGMSQATWYRYKNDLRAAAGVDVTRAPNVVSLGVRMQQQARPVQARYATLADVRRLYAGLREVA